MLGQRTAQAYNNGKADDGSDELLGAADLPALFHEMRPDIERLLRRRVRCPHLAADLAGDIYLKLHRESSFSGTLAEARAFLLRVAINHATDHFRVESRRSEILRENAHVFDREVESAERGALAKSDLAQVEIALASLPQKMARILILSRVHGLTHAEIASELGVSRSLVEKYVLRALLHCRAHLQKLEAAGRC